jgi:hypothetical protein
MAFVSGENAGRLVSPSSRVGEPVAAVESHARRTVV